MALEHDTQEHDAASAAAAGDDGSGGDELAGALGDGSDGGAFVSEQKKPFNTSSLILGGFLLACGVGTYVMYSRNANANSAPTAEAAAAQTTITQFLSDDRASVDKMKDLLANTDKAVAQFKNAPAKAQVPVEDLQTNPFRFAQAKDDDAPVQDVDTVTAKKRDEATRAALLKAAEGLQVQFIVSGRKKSCMINNARYVEGDAVGEFTVQSINTSTVVIAKGDAKFELQMKK